MWQASCPINNAGVAHKLPALKPEHIAEKVLELVSPDSRVVSGKIIEIHALPIPQL